MSCANNTTTHICKTKPMSPKPNPCIQSHNPCLQGSKGLFTDHVLDPSRANPRRLFTLLIPHLARLQAKSLQPSSKRRRLGGHREKLLHVRAQACPIPPPEHLLNAQLASLPAR
ncbi:hypothetical protein AUP68_05948 [Ilyonectria robusta]